MLHLKTFESFGTEPTLVPLNQYYKTLPNKEALIGSKVWDDINGEWIFVKNVEDGLFCGADKDDEHGDYYNIDDLKIEVE